MTTATTETTGTAPVETTNTSPDATAPVTTNPDVTPDAKVQEGAPGTEVGDGTGSVEAGTTGAPETYAEFTIPEGVEFDAAAMESATTLFRELGLNQEQAQKMIDQRALALKAGQESEQAAFARQLTEWETQSKADKEIGGKLYDQSIATATIALQKFATPELQALLEHCGLVKHPEVIRMMNKIGSLLREDNPGGGDSPVNSQRSVVDRMYPDATH